MLEGLGLVAKVVAGLEASGVRHAVFARVEPNVPAHLVEEGLALYKSSGCDGIVVVGGGSPMDCAKLIGACVCRYESFEIFFIITPSDPTYHHSVSSCVAMHLVTIRMVVPHFASRFAHNVWTRVFRRRNMK